MNAEQLGFYKKKVHIKTYRLSKKQDAFVMLCISRNKEFQFVYLTKTIFKTTSNVILNMKKVDLIES